MLNDSAVHVAARPGVASNSDRVPGVPVLCNRHSKG